MVIICVNIVEVILKKYQKIKEAAKVKDKNLFEFAKGEKLIFIYGGLFRRF